MATTSRRPKPAADLDDLIAQTAVQPRPYQQRIVGKAVDLFADAGLRSILIDSPTGSGKTVMGLLIARALQERLGVRVGWVAMRRYLLAQARAENEDQRIGVDAAFISMFDRDPPTGLDLLVVDEAQHDAAPEHGATCTSSSGRASSSACRRRRSAADRVKLCFDRVLKDAGIQSLIQDGYLSARTTTTPFPPTRPQIGRRLLPARPAALGQDDALLPHAGAVLRGRRPACRRPACARDVVSGDSDREAQLEAFRGGRLDVLSNCMMLSEGFDCPELKTVFCRPSCKGVTVQMGGRVLRKHPAVAVQADRAVRPDALAVPAHGGRRGSQFAWSDGELAVAAGSTRSSTRSPAGRCSALARIEVSLPKFLDRSREPPGRGRATAGDRRRRTLKNRAR